MNPDLGDGTRKSASVRTCVFCGEPADSREHVLAKRLYNRAGAARLVVLQGLYAEGKGTVTRNRHLLSAFKVRRVCRTCNSTWMNDLETWFEDRLGLLIEPDWPRLALTIIENLKDERVKLAHWLIKTAVTFSLAVLKGNLPLDFPFELTKKVKDGVLPDRCWVDLAYSHLPTVGGAIGKCFRIFNGGQYNPSQVFGGGVGFRFAVQFNHLLLRMARAPGTNVTYQSWDGEVPIRLYPIATPRMPDNFAYQDIMKFEHAVILETWLNCQGNVA